MTLQAMYRAEAVCGDCGRTLGRIGPIQEDKREEAAAEFQAFAAGMFPDCRLGEVRWALHDPSVVGGTVIEAFPVLGEGA